MDRSFASPIIKLVQETLLGKPSKTTSIIFSSENIRLAEQIEVALLGKPPPIYYYGFGNMTLAEQLKKEENILYPMIDGCLSEEKQSELMTEF